MILKVVKCIRQAKSTNFLFDGTDKLAGEGWVTLLKGNSLDAVNSLENPVAVSPVTKPASVKR